MLCGILGVASLYAQDAADLRKKLIDEAQARLISRIAITGGPVKNAPYSGLSVSEEVQVLADGNRIVHKTTTMHYRDSMGRERTENNIGEDGVPMTIFITDPVEGVKYTLWPADKVAVKTFSPKIVSDEPKVAAKLDLESLLKAKVDPIVMTSHTGGGSGLAMVIPDGFQTSAAVGETKSDDLGTQTKEGVPVQGTRRTTTIPAGKMGNERDIVTVMERWMSPDLQVMVESTRTDPRSGTNTYKLTNIIRAEPAPSLFQVPADYTLKDITRPSTKDEER
jgi:hypothetical protein